MSRSTDKSSASRGMYGALTSATLATVAVAMYLFSEGPYKPFVSGGCQEGLTTSKAWCSFDKPSGFQFASPCACVRGCDDGPYHVCRVNTTGVIKDYQALMHDTETVYLDPRLQVENVETFLAQSGPW